MASEGRRDSVGLRASGGRFDQVASEIDVEEERNYYIDEWRGFHDHWCNMLRRISMFSLCHKVREEEATKESDARTCEERHQGERED